MELFLERWANFYLVTSTAAATLIGLLFVVITIAAERRSRDVAKIRLYLTPTVVFFSSILGVAALLTFPNHTQLSAATCVGLVGVAGWTCEVSLLVRRGGDRHAYNYPSELFEYVGLPVVAYGLLVAGSVFILRGSQHALTFVAVGLLSLLTIAIRNSWAIAVDVVSSRPR